MSATKCYEIRSYENICYMLLTFGLTFYKKIMLEDGNL